MSKYVACFLFLVVAGLADAMPSDEMFDKLRNAPSDSEASDAAQDIWASWMESGSPTIDMIMERARQSLTLGDTESARTYYDRVILIDPSYPEAWNHRAGIFLQQENYAEALRDINETLRLEPRHFAAWLRLANIFESLDAPTQALDAYREAIRIYPRMPQALQAEKRLAKLIDGQGL